MTEERIGQGHSTGVVPCSPEEVLPLKSHGLQIQIIMMHNAISAIKANHLFWLGRYAERVYLCLHLLRRYYDKSIDNTGQEYEEYCRKLEVENPYEGKDAFRLGYMYDAGNASSLLSGMERAYDNAVVLREEISSEVLSYIQLSRSLIRRKAEEQDENITGLQDVTDYLMAFWGSVDERILQGRVHDILYIGRWVEEMDLHLRFDYPFYRIRSTFDQLKLIAGHEDGHLFFDRMMLQKLDEMLTEQCYADGHKAALLKYVNQLVLL